jgi:hypothetical protein
VRDGVRDVAPGEAEDLGVASRPAVPCGGGFLAVVDIVWDVQFVYRMMVCGLSCLLRGTETVARDSELGRRECEVRGLGSSRSSLADCYDLALIEVDYRVSER